MEEYIHDEVDDENKHNSIEENKNIMTRINMYRI